MIPQTHITADTPMGATLVKSGGATFRVWAPRASQVYLNGTFQGVLARGQAQQLLLANDGSGYWTGFKSDAAAGDLYRYYVVGDGSSGYKRDPYARELALDPAFPDCGCVIRPGSAYPWHDAAFVAPDFSTMIVYQLHIGTYAPPSTAAMSTFLDIIEKIDYLATLGINVLQPLPVDETETYFSLGYNGSDLFSPDSPYAVRDPAALDAHLSTINRLLARKGCAPMSIADISPPSHQLKAMVDLCHLFGIAVIFDVVYNHVGGFEGDDQSLYFFDRAAPTTDNNQSLYCTDQGWAGGLSFALWNRDVRQFLINNARFFLDECHVDGFRYDEISVLLALNADDGWQFCQDLTGTVRYSKPRALQNAEHWPVSPAIVTPSAAGGAGFDVSQHDALRIAVRSAVAQSAGGQGAAVDFDAIARALYPPGFAHGWQAVTCLENHDIVKVGTDMRIPRLADASNARSWYARSRSRVAAVLLLTAPGIPQLFMGQEFLEDKQWDCDLSSDHLIWWQGLTSGTDTAMVDHLRFMQELIALRRRHPAISGDAVRVFHVHNDNRVIAFHRWLEGTGRDVIVVATLAEATWYGYALGFPYPGPWMEVFNSDVYDNWVNPRVAGNGGGIDAADIPLHGFLNSAPIVIPANGVVVFARDAGDGAPTSL